MKEFEHFTDREKMKAVFQQQLQGFTDGHLSIEDCRIGFTKYRTYKRPESKKNSSLSILYRLKVKDHLGKKTETQSLYAKVYLGKRSEIEYKKVESGPFVSPRYGVPIVHLPKLGTILFAFPNDPVLSHLPECIDPKKVARYLPYDRLPSGLDSPEDILNIKAEIVHYRPEVRCTTRYSLEWGLKDAPKKITIFGKTFKNDQGLTLFTRSAALIQEIHDDENSFLIAEPLGYHEEIKTIWQAGLDGRPLTDLIDKTNVRSLIKSVALGLAHFHQSALRSPEQITVNDHLIAIGNKIDKLIHGFPKLSEALRSIQQGLKKSAGQFSPVVDVLIHADFSVQQLLVCGDKIACFDFDEFAMGDPIQDVANFIVDCHFRSFDKDFVPLMISTFIETYERKSGNKVSMNRLAWYLQILFITKAYRFYIQQKPRLEEEIRAIISLSQQVMSRELRFIQ